MLKTVKIKIIYKFKQKNIESLKILKHHIFPIKHHIFLIFAVSAKVSIFKEEQSIEIIKIIGLIKERKRKPIKSN